MGAKRKYVGQNLFNLLYVATKDNYSEYFPDVESWETIRSKRKLYRRYIRKGKVEEPMQNSDGKLQSDFALAKVQLREALRQRDKAREKNIEFMAAIKAAIFELYAEIQLDVPEPRIIKNKPEGTPEVAILAAGDWQLGKKTPTYNTQVCEQRIQRLAEKAIELGRLHARIKPIDELHLYLLGDMIEGDGGIFPSQAYLVDSSLFQQVGVHGPRILSNLIGELLNFFPKIHVVGVIGNHGNLKIQGGAVNPETNMDRLLYEIVKNMFRNEDRVTWDIPQGDGERNFYAVDRLPGGWGSLLMHGDQIRGGVAGLGPSLQRKALGWIDSIPEEWDYLFYGHHHTPAMLTINRRQARCNGSSESNNTYAQESLAAIGHPTQWMGFVSPNQGITAEYWIHLEEKLPNKLRER